MSLARKEWIEIDRKRFESLGIIEWHLFEIKELTGIYVLDLENRCIRDVTHCAKSYDGQEVHGLYDSLLNGAWHKRTYFGEE